ncbi:single-stranded DNA-binding protein [uncultured Anaerococcus sp.]|uniref:single-stranded DNA-binding protein n=1 Tax=uncultured Anaerococcus sp. TaxID=293428 RepID=UPI00262F8FAB|nr:single-stranded DNA-binding protein [uncultured Anaerococcus sp.]
MNTVILSGRLTKDPELRYTQSQKAVVSFTLAVDRGLSKQKRQEAEGAGCPTADFIRVIVFGLQAENASKYLSKGSKCLIDGRIQTGSYEDRQTGKRIYTTDVIAERVEYLDSQNSTKTGSNSNENNLGDNLYGENNNLNTGANNDDFFEDDFEEMGDGQIPF